MKILGIILAVALLGCPGAFGRVASSAIDGAIVTNNAMVDVLVAVQSSAKAQRKAVLMRIARTATSKADGERQIKLSSSDYAGVFESLRNAEAAQNALADALAVARSAVEAGRSPSLDRIMLLYGQLQKAHGSIMQSMSEVGR